MSESIVGSRHPFIFFKLVWKVRCQKIFWGYDGGACLHFSLLYPFLDPLWSEVAISYSWVEGRKSHTIPQSTLLANRFRRQSSHHLDIHFLERVVDLFSWWSFSLQMQSVFGVRSIEP